MKGSTWKDILIAIAVLLFIFSLFGSCTSDDEDECIACNGTGYYQKRDCPFC